MGQSPSQALAEGATPSSEQARLTAKLRQTLLSDSFQPVVLATTALELLDLARDPEVPLGRVREVIEREPALAVSLLKTANSPFYSRGNPVESLDEALVRLGVQRVSGIFMETALRAAALTGSNYQRSLEQLRRHMTATGHIARGVSRMLKRPGERAFICGLLHDVGVAGCFAIAAGWPKGERPRETPELTAAIDSIHEEASGIMGIKWSLPWGVQWVIGHHHNIWVDGRVSPLAALVALADWLATTSGAPGLGPLDERPAQAALEYFAFGPSARTKLFERAKRIVEQVTS